MFRSAMPFGASLFYVLLFGSILIGGTLLLVGWTRDWRLLRRSGACLVIVGIGWLCLNAYLHSLMDWNPCIDSEELVIGTWADERETITLHADHRVDYHSWNGVFQARGA